MRGISRISGPALAVVATLLPCGVTGCANLVVKKVPVAKRAAGADNHVKGFRYYMNRPYLVVLDKVQVKEERTLVRVDRKDRVDPNAQLVVFLEGSRKGETATLGELKANGAKVALSPVRPSEVAGIRQALAHRASVGDAPEGSGRDSDVVRAQVALEGPRPVPPDQEIVTGAVVTGTAADLAATTNPSMIAPGRAAFAENLGLPTTGTVKNTSLPKGKMQIVFLPDLDEQYAVKSKNLLARTAFGLTFRDGANLDAVEANHDSTEVAIALLKTIDKAIAGAQAIEQASIDKQSKTLASSPGSSKSLDLLGERAEVFQLVETYSIKPGMYRLNKPWEVTGEGVEPMGTGLLAKLGLPVMKEVEVRSVGDTAK